MVRAYKNSHKGDKNYILETATTSKEDLINKYKNRNSRMGVVYSEADQQDAYEKAKQEKQTQ